MRPTVSLTLVVALITSALPVTAQERIDKTAGPISRAITHEAVRLAAEADAVDASEQAGRSTNADWSRVRKLARGTRLILTVKGEQPRRWVFGRADNFQLTVRDPTGREGTITRNEIVEIMAFITHGSVAGAIGGSVLGAWLGGAAALSLLLTVQCQPSCGGVEALAVLSAVGIPIGAGLLGYHAFGHSTEDVIYRAP